MIHVTVHCCYDQDGPEHLQMTVYPVLLQKPEIKPIPRADMYEHATINASNVTDLDT